MHEELRDRLELDKDKFGSRFCIEKYQRMFKLQRIYDAIDPEINV